MRTIKKIHKAVNSPIDDLITFRALPTHSIEHIDPFLFLNHHGPQDYRQNNNGLPFGPHPHRGFETLTFILEGDLAHWDSGGGSNVIKAGGIQWMTAGKGLVHAEVSSDEFKKNGGRIEILQLWLNLPKKLKMTAPNYIGLQRDQIPVYLHDDEKVKVHVVSGALREYVGKIDSLTGIGIGWLELKEGGRFALDVPLEKNVFFYVVKGKVTVNGENAEMHNLVEFTNDSLEINVEATEDAVVIIGHGTPFHEPIVAQGPFVMNSVAEIKQAFADYRDGVIR